MNVKHSTAVVYRQGTATEMSYSPGAPVTCLNALSLLKLELPPAGALAYGQPGSGAVGGGRADAARAAAAPP